MYYCFYPALCPPNIPPCVSVQDWPIVLNLKGLVLGQVLTVIDLETRTLVQGVYLGGDPRKHN